MNGPKSGALKREEDDLLSGFFGIDVRGFGGSGSVIWIYGVRMRANMGFNPKRSWGIRVLTWRACIEGSWYATGALP